MTSAVFLNAFGRYDEALAVAEHAAEHRFELGLSTWVYPELIEAAVRSDHADRAAPALDSLTEIAQAAGTEWLLGMVARCRALLAGGDGAEALYQESIERLGRTRIRVALARSQLLYGEWLRRSGRRTDAREQLRGAHEFFSEAGMAGFAERTRRELAATGETVRARSVDTANDLTAQETLIARLAVEGRSNPEIGAQLFISPRTVEWHLGKVFAKLGVESRKGLRDAIAPAGLGPSATSSPPAASRMRSAITSGWVIIERWPLGTRIVIASIRSARNDSSSGDVVRSSVETAYHDGLPRQAASVVREAKRVSAIRPCTAECARAVRRRSQSH